jgi:hypothetical protein
MKWFALLFCLSAGFSAYAQADAVIADEIVQDAELGDVKILVKDIGHPVYAPLQLYVSVLCKDNRVSKTAAVPKWEPARRTQAICAWGGHNYDASAKKLVINFSDAAIVVGDAPCEAQPPKSIDLRKACARWNK